MKNFIIALLLFCGLATSLSLAGECDSCKVVRTPRRVVNFETEIVEVPVTTKSVIRTRPVRRWSNRAVIVSSGSNCNCGSSVSEPTLAN